MRFFPGSTLRARLLLVVLVAPAPTVRLAIYSDMEGFAVGAEIIGLGAVFALVLAWLGGDLFIVRRTSALVAATRRVAAGDLSARTGVPYGRGEIGQLARAFDEMAADLQVRDVNSREAEARCSVRWNRCERPMSRGGACSHGSITLRKRNENGSHWTSTTTPSR